jgi:hypothetical protein
MTHAEQILLMQPVVDAARELCLANEHAKFGVFGAVERSTFATEKLAQLVDAYNALADKAAE